MADVALIYCSKLKDYLCVACSRCLRQLNDKTGDFSRYDAVHLVALSDCGNCPGLIAPRVKLLVEDAAKDGRKIDAVHLGPCIRAAKQVAKCPLDLATLRGELKADAGIETLVGHWQA